MANVVPYSFAQELLKGTHNFTSNTIKLALYTANPYTTASTAYSSGSANHVSGTGYTTCLLYTSPSPRDRTRSRMPSSA